MPATRFKIRWSDTFNELRIEGDVDESLFAGEGLEVVLASDYDKLDLRLQNWKEAT